MVFPSRLLIYGSDPLLMETRRWVLERSSFLVRTALDLGGVRGILGEADIDIFLLCHSISPQDRERALALAHSLRPEMKNLVMEGFCSAFSPGAKDTILDAFSDTRTLISTIQRMSGPRSLVLRDLSSVGEMETVLSPRA